MPRENLLHTYDAHGIYLFPSFFEGFAQTFLEAMARGLAVLATRIDGMAQAIRNGKNGYLFERGCPNEMADVAISLIDEQVDLENLGRDNNFIHNDHWIRCRRDRPRYLTLVTPRLFLGTSVPTISYNYRWHEQYASAGSVSQVFYD